MIIVVVAREIPFPFPDEQQIKEQVKEFCRQIARLDKRQRRASRKAVRRTFGERSNPLTRTKSARPTQMSSGFG